MPSIVKDPNDVIIGQNVKKRRMVTGMTQTELADLLGITFQQVQKYEKASNRISAGRLVTIAGHLKCSIIDLCKGTGADEQAEAETDAYRDTRQGLNLCKAMEAIPNMSLRRKIVGLAETLAQ